MIKAERPFRKYAGIEPFSKRVCKAGTNTDNTHNTDTVYNTDKFDNTDNFNNIDIFYNSEFYGNSCDVSLLAQ